MAKLRITRGERWQDIPIDKERFSIGRSEDCDYVVKSGFISRHHCEILTDENGQFFIRDSGTRLGTMVNDRPVRHEPLDFGDKIRLSNRFEAVFLDDIGTGHTSTMRAVQNRMEMNRPHLIGMTEPVSGREFVLNEDRSLVGRDPSCDIAIPLDTVSKFHAEILMEGEQATVVDLNSSNGTFIDNERVDRARVSPGSVLRFDRVSFRLQKSKLEVGKTGTLVRLPLDLEEGKQRPPSLDKSTAPSEHDMDLSLERDVTIGERPSPAAGNKMSGGKLAAIIILLIVVVGAAGVGGWLLLQSLLKGV